MTKSGKTKFTLILEAQETVQVTQLRIRSEKGPSGVKCGMVFLLPIESLVNKRYSITISMLYAIPSHGSIYVT